MRLGTSTASATSPGTPRARPPRRFAIAAFATLLVASTGPGSAWASEDRSERRARSDQRSLRLTEDQEARTAPAVWLTDLHALIESARTALADVASAGTGDVPSATVRATAPRLRPSSRPFSMNLYRRGDFVNQKTAYWCIPASTQTMINIMDAGRPDRTRSLQARFYRVGDRLEEDGSFSVEPEPDRFRGMGISEWAGLLNRFDYGPYGLAGYRSRQNALRNAAIMMRRTRKPVGLVVWRGAHAWVMSGFTATADPARTRDFRVTSVVVHDPWYPRVSSIWGRSRPPNARVSPRVLGQDFRPYGRPGRRNPERDGRYILVLPGRTPAPPEA